MDDNVRLKKVYLSLKSKCTFVNFLSEYIICFYCCIWVYHLLIMLLLSSPNIWYLAKFSQKSRNFCCTSSYPLLYLMRHVMVLSTTCVQHIHANMKVRNRTCVAATIYNRSKHMGHMEELKNVEERWCYLFYPKQRELDRSWWSSNISTLKRTNQENKIPRG